MSRINNKKVSSACNRNQLPILTILKKYFPTTCRIIEVASGTGQHADFFTKEEPGWIWQASDSNSSALTSIHGYHEDANRHNFPPPKQLSTNDTSWNVDIFDAAFCCNMMHICPWTDCIQLFYHLKQHLKQDAPLIIYGPFIQDRVATSVSNHLFDKSLRRQNPEWGLRRLNDVERIATEHSFNQLRIHKMPAHNLMVIYVKN